MKKRIFSILYWFLAVCPLLLSAVFYRSLPDQVPVHWDAAGAVNHYASRPMAAFGYPAILLLLTVYVNFRIYSDPKRQNIEQSPVMKFMGRWMIVLLSNVMQIMILLSAFQAMKSINLIFIIIGILFVGIGNYLPKCKFNYSVGIRLPWTLSSEGNWNKTHRLAGFVWVAGGILMLVNAFLSNRWLSLTVIALMILIPGVYSYLLFLKSNLGGSSSEDQKS